MAKETDTTKTILRLGFAAMTLLLVVIAGFSLNRVDKLTRQLSSIVEFNSRKIELVSKMRRSVEERWVDLHKIISAQDIFERDKWLQSFYAGSKRYRIARETFSVLPHTHEERSICDKLDKNISIAQPIVRHFVEGMVDDPLPFPPEEAIEKVKYFQGTVLSTLEEMVLQVQKDANAAVNEAKSDLTHTYTIMLILISSIILLTMIIAKLVTHSVNKNNMALANATKVKSRFLANMSHEIRTPLTAIIGFAEHLLTPNLNQTEQQVAANTIIRNGAHLQHIVDEILDLSKDEANKLEAYKTEVWLLDLIAEIKETFDQQVSKKGLQFEIHYQPPIPKRITTDPVKLKQILFNLCNNAIKFTDEGKVSLNISCNIKAQQLHFDVIDSGIGISDEELKKIFQPFVQADSSATRKFGGTGLGLHLSSRFAAILDGTLSVDSDYGHGSCFTLSLPTGEILEQDIVSDFTHMFTPFPVTSDSLDTQNLHGEILLAEDTKDNQLLVRAFLKNTNVHLTTVENGQEAINAALQGTFDLILMDIQMPVINGLQATCHLRNKGWTGPIVALTANIMPEDCQRYLDNGFNDVIGKPINRALFMEKISSYLVENTNEKLIFSTLLDDNPDFLPAVEYFVQQTDDECQKLTLSLTDKNWHELKQQLHRLKGSGGGVGFPLVTELALDAEQMIKEENYAVTGQLINKLVNVLQRLRCPKSSEASHALH